MSGCESLAADLGRAAALRDELDNARAASVSLGHRFRGHETDAAPIHRATRFISAVDAVSLPIPLREWFALHAWVVMPEHVHLLITPHGDSDLGKALRSIKLPVAIEAIKRWTAESARHEFTRSLPTVHTPRGEPRFWQPGGGFDHNVRSEASLIKIINYIHNNPVERELVASPIEWRWSSIHWWLSRETGPCRDQGECPVPCDLPRGSMWPTWKPRIGTAAPA